MNIARDVAFLDQVSPCSYLPHARNECPQCLLVGVGKFLEALKLSDKHLASGNDWERQSPTLGQSWDKTLRHRTAFNGQRQIKARNHSAVPVSRECPSYRKAFTIWCTQHGVKRDAAARARWQALF